MKGKSYLWQLVRFEIAVYGWYSTPVLLLVLAPFLQLLIRPLYDRAAVDVQILTVAPVIALFLGVVVYAPHSLLGTDLDYREFLLTRAIGPRRIFWVKTGIIGTLLGVLCVANLAGAAFRRDLWIEGSWNGRAVYVDGLAGSRAYLEPDADQQSVARTNGFVGVWVPDGHLRALDFEIWCCFCLAVLAQTAVVGTSRPRRVLWIALIALGVLPPMVPAVAVAISGRVAPILEQGLFVFDRHPAMLWLLALATAAAAQRLNAKRFAQTELA